MFLVFKDYLCTFGDKSKMGDRPFLFKLTDWCFGPGSNTEGAASSEKGHLLPLYMYSYSIRLTLCSSCTVYLHH